MAVRSMGMQDNEAAWQSRLGAEDDDSDGIFDQMEDIFTPGELVDSSGVVVTEEEESLPQIPVELQKQQDPKARLRKILLSYVTNEGVKVQRAVKDITNGKVKALESLRRPTNTEIVKLQRSGALQQVAGGANTTTVWKPNWKRIACLVGVAGLSYVGYKWWKQNKE